MARDKGPTGSPPAAPSGRAVAEPGTWVLLHKVVLPAGKRAPGIPPETQAVPLEMRVKGFLLGGPDGPGTTAAVGDDVTVKTLSGRTVQGTLAAVRPPIPHDFGSPVPELLAVGPELRRLLEEAEHGSRH